MVLITNPYIHIDGAKGDTVYTLQAVYAKNVNTVRDHILLMRDTLCACRKRFGDSPVWIFRVTGRKNLRRSYAGDE